jgi:hypothetical protein
MKNWGQGYDASGCGADIALEYLQRTPPPFIFGSPKPVDVGDTFMIKDQPFVVTRKCDVSEYIAKMGSDRYVDRCVSFFEAATD